MASTDVAASRFVPDERLAKYRGDLAAMCEQVGRDSATLEITVGITVKYPDLITGPVKPPDPEDAPEPALSGTPGEIAEGLAAHAALGAGHVIAALEPTTPETVRRFGEAVERFRSSPRR